MSNIGLNTGLKALLSARYVLDTIGHNIANANTPGYSRQRVHLSSALPLSVRGLLIGNGVDAALVGRSVDQLLATRILGQRSVMGGLDSQLGGLSQIESLFGEPGEGGLSALIDGLFSSASELSTGPDDTVLQTGLTQATMSLSQRLNELANSLARTGTDAEGEIRSRVESANRYAAEIAELNIQIAETQASNLSANDLLDRRDLVLGKLAELADVTTTAGPNGTVRVLVAGHTLVSSDRFNELSVSKTSSGDLEIQLAGTSGSVDVKGGSIGGLLELGQTLAPDYLTRLDELAHELIRNVNRLHSTGVPAGGSFHNLLGSNALQDFDQDGNVTDELLSNAGLPFEVTNGALYVNVVNETTGAHEKHRIAISETHTTVQQFIDELNAIPHVNADLEATGHLRISSDTGYGFDFSRRLDLAPDMDGTFGGGEASLGAGVGPYSLADGDTLDITSNSVSFQVTFSQSDFFDISQATAEEVAAVVNADPNAQANGVVAAAVGDQVFLQSAGVGSTASFTVDGGSSVAAFGWGAQVGNPVNGHDDSVDVVIGGAYRGETDGSFTFRPNMDGTVGTTPGLAVEVFDANGQLVATLDVGPEYTPGSTLTVADGVTVSFGLGELSATHNDAFDLDLVADSDTADVLVALGLNGLFTGKDASDIALSEDIEHDPGLIASSISGAPGDNTMLLELLALEDSDLVELEGDSLGQFYGSLVGDLGFDTASTSSALQANDVLIQSLEQRRDQISGVNVDEELVDLLAYEQAFAAAAQYISVVNEISDELLNLI